MDSPRSPLDEGEIPDDESKEFDDGYDENLMGDEEDKLKLGQMTEKEREQELFNRSERRETLKIRFEIERKLRSKAKKREQEKKQSKQVRARKRLRASEIYSSDESSEESDEYTPDTDKSSALNDINTSGKPNSNIKTRASALLMSSSSESSASSASSSGSDSEPENDDMGDDDSQTAHDDFQMTLDELKQLQLKRDQVEQWIYSPFFKETAIGLFVKISVMVASLDKTPMYKVGQVVDVTTGTKIYAINATEAKNRTDKKCLVRTGGVERTYDWSFVSNRSIDADDYRKWKDSMHSDGQNMPSREFFNRKKRDLHRARNYEYKDEDIMYEVAEKRRFKDSPHNFALKKTELMGEKAEAEASNDYEKARQIQAQIDVLEEKAKQLEKSRSSSTFSAISFVNERNRIKNIEESERVLKESKTIKTEDPFTRRKCTPTIVHNKNNNGDLLKQQSGDKDGQQQQQQPDNKTPNGKPSTAAIIGNKNATNSTTKNGTPKAESLESVNDLFQAHASIDLEIDIDI